VLCYTSIFTEVLLQGFSGLMRRWVCVWVLPHCLAWHTSGVSPLGNYQWLKLEDHRQISQTTTVLFSSLYRSGGYGRLATPAAC
jgi:hypothetical protein